MPEWPESSPPTLIVSPFSRECVGHSNSLAAAASATWPASSVALFLPFALSRPTVFKRLALDNGTAVSGNLDMGLYDWTGTRLVSAGSTAQSGTNAIQALTISDTLLGAGHFYLALVLDNTTGTVIRLTSPYGTNQNNGIVEMASAFPLPATATFAQCTRSFIPYMAAATKTVI